MRAGGLLVVGVLLFAAPARADDPQQEYEVKLRDLERRVEELKEQVRRMKRRDPPPLVFYPYTVAISDRIGAGLRLVGARVWLGPELVLSVADERGLSPELSVDGYALFAEHTTLEVELTLRGDDPVFSYTSAYRATLRGKAAVQLVAGERTLLALEALEQGDATTPLLARPAIRLRDQALIARPR
jgi:hypothetical protein